jgi:antitoxin YokJ
MNLDKLLNRIRVTPDCLVYPASGTPIIHPDHLLPEDMQNFYRLCGGVTLYDDSEYAIDIVSPQELVLANPIIFLDAFEEPSAMEKEKKENTSWSWYIIGKGNSGEYVTIDLAPARLGRCYYSFWDRHAMKGYSSIIAVSFTDLLYRLIDNRGQQWYWEQPGFQSLGDAYD